jgi:hypothetical protein
MRVISNYTLVRSSPCAGGQWAGQIRPQVQAEYHEASHEGHGLGVLWLEEQRQPGVPQLGRDDERTAVSKAVG